MYDLTIVTVYQPCSRYNSLEHLSTCSHALYAPTVPSYPPPSSTFLTHKPSKYGVFDDWRAVWIWAIHLNIFIFVFPL